MKSKNLKKLIALSLSLAFMTGSSLCVGATGSGYSGSGYSGSNSNNPVVTETAETTNQTVVVSESSNSGSDNSNSSTSSNVVKNVVTKADGTILRSTVSGRYTTKKFAGTAVLSAKADVNAALGVQNGETAWISISDSTCGKKAMKTVTEVSESMGAKVAGILDIYGSKITSSGKRVDISHPGAAIQYTIGIPSSIKAPEGYQLAVLRVYGDNGVGKADLLKDMDNDPNTVTISSDKFGVFAFVYVKNL